jgi:hypothetical protein
MRTLNKNKQKMKYSIKGERKPIYETDSDGNIIYYEDEEGNRIPIETGSYTSGWNNPEDFKGNIAMSSGEVEAKEFGLSVADYDAVLVLDKNEVPLEEGSLIWHEKEVKFKDDGEVDTTSADYTVKKVANSLNSAKYVLKAVV